MKRKQIHRITDNQVNVTCRGGALVIVDLYCKVHPWTVREFDPKHAKRAFGYPVEGGKTVIHCEKYDAGIERDLHGCKVYSGVIDPIWDGVGDFPGTLMGVVYYHEGELCLVRDIDRSGMTNWEFMLHEKYHKTVGVK